MGNSGSAPILEIKQQQIEAMKKQDQLAAAQQTNLKLQSATLQAAKEQEEISRKQFEEQMTMLLEQQKMLAQQQKEAKEMALVAMQQQDQIATGAAERALKKAEEMRRRITPPAKPGKVNIIVQTDRTIPPSAIMKRRKPKDPNSVEQDHREECGGVGFDAVAAPSIAQVPVMMAVNKNKDGDEAQDDDYEYQYEYQYQYMYADAGPKAMVAPPAGPAATADLPAPGLQKPTAPLSVPPSLSVGPKTALPSRPAARKPAPPKPDDDDDYEYEYEEQEVMES